MDCSCQPPCAGAGQACGEGTPCCDGFCDGSGVCPSSSQ
jgi:hypothetical protein